MNETHFGFESLHLIARFSNIRVTRRTNGIIWIHINQNVGDLDSDLHWLSSWCATGDEACHEWSRNAWIHILRWVFLTWPCGIRKSSVVLQRKTNYYACMQWGWQFLQTGQCLESETTPRPPPILRYQRDMMWWGHVPVKVKMRPLMMATRPSGETGECCRLPPTAWASSAPPPPRDPASPN